MTSQLVYQRIRNRIIENLEWILNEGKNPSTMGLDSLVDAWEDWVPIPLPEDHFPGPVFSPSENACLRDVSSALNEFCDATPFTIKDHAAALMLPEWSAVVVAAQEALTTMMERGMMDEDEEISFE